jgi:hypothetical protein
MDNIKYATKRLIDSVWTLGYKQISPSEIEIVSYDRKNQIGYDQEKTLPRVHLVEDDKRTVLGVHICENATSKSWASKDDPYFKVVNPDHVFSYGA